MDFPAPVKHDNPTVAGSMYRIDWEEQIFGRKPSKYTFVFVHYSDGGATFPGIFVPYSIGTSRDRD